MPAVLIFIVWGIFGVGLESPTPGIVGICFLVQKVTVVVPRTSMTTVTAQIAKKRKPTHIKIS